jgi:hypothetical protein
MLVWNAISSIVLMIRDTCWLDSWMAAIDDTISASVSFDVRTCPSTRSSGRPRSASSRLSGRVIDAISSIEAEVSSSDAACSVAPCASDCAAVDT